MIGANQCQHGQLARVCLTCEHAAEIERLTAESDRAREYHAAELADVTAERDHAVEQAAKNCDEVLALRAQVAALEADIAAEKLFSKQAMQAAQDMAAQRDALEVDALRYRWLRSQPLDDPEIWIAVDSASVPSRWALGGDDPDGCDAAIDAALAARKGAA